MKAKEEQILSISALSRHFNLDRATVSDRLARAEVKPVSEKASEKLYRLEDVEQVLSQDELDAAKLEKLQAEAALKKFELAVKQGDYAPVAEFAEAVSRIFGRLHRRLAVQMPDRMAGRLHKAESQAAIARLLKDEIQKEFASLKADFTQYL